MHPVPKLRICVCEALPPSLLDAFMIFLLDKEITLCLITFHSSNTNSISV
jgi:hypothetical protein